MKRLIGLIGAVLAALALNAQASVLTVSGSNAGGADLYDGYPAFRLDFTIAGDGVYTFQTSNASFDTFLELYPGDLVLPAASFNPIAFDDDGSSETCGDFYCSLIEEVPLVAGAYSLFVRGSSGEVGTFDLSLTAVQGPGVFLSEPASFAALGLGLAMLAATRRRREALPA